MNCVNFESVPPDEANHDRYLPGRLNAAFATPELAQTDGQDTETDNKESQMNRWKRKLLLFLPDEDDRSDQADQQSHPAGGRCIETGR